MLFNNKLLRLVYFQSSTILAQQVKKYNIMTFTLRKRKITRNLYFVKDQCQNQIQSSNLNLKCLRSRYFYFQCPTHTIFFAQSCAQIPSQKKKSVQGPQGPCASKLQSEFAWWSCAQSSWNVSSTVCALSFTVSCCDA